MEQGPNEAKIIDQARRLNMPVPDKIKNKPELLPGLELYWKAYSDLSSDRDVGMGVGPIPWSALHNWGIRNKIIGDDFERLVLVVRGLDSVFLEKQNTMNKKSVKGKGRGSFSKPKHMGGK